MNGPSVFNKDKIILFTHIPKCAGTSFRSSLIDPNIPEDMQYRPSGKITKIITHRIDFQYIIGHFPVGIEQLISPFNPARKKEKIYVTFLREPVDQMISYYYFQKQLGKSSKFKNSLHLEIDIFYKRNPLAQNLQTRFCAGFMQDLFYRKINFISSNKWILRKAQKNLVHKFSFVGQFENLSNDMDKLSGLYNLEYRPIYNTITKTKQRPNINDIDKEIIDELQKINKLDVELYQFAKNNIWLT